MCYVQTILVTFKYLCISHTVETCYHCHWLLCMFGDTQNDVNQIFVLYCMHTNGMQPIC